LRSALLTGLVGFSVVKGTGVLRSIAVQGCHKERLESLSPSAVFSF